jgi:hypothetical protein
MRLFLKLNFANAALLIVVICLSTQLCTSQTLITSNTPTISDARESLQGRIREQSDGGIKLVSWNSESPALEFEMNGQKAYLVTYNAEIEFTEPCEWASHFQDQSCTFKILKRDTVKPATGEFFDVSKAGERFILKGVVIFTRNQDGWSASEFRLTYTPEKPSDQISMKCMINIKQIWLSQKNWAERHNGKFPFNVSTNAGGSKELRPEVANEFDTNSAPQFQNLASGLVGFNNGAFTPKVLVCPADASKHSADNFQMVQNSNVSYQLRYCTNNIGDVPPRILARCPIHGWALYTDGSILPHDK